MALAHTLRLLEALLIASSDSWKQKANTLELIWCQFHYTYFTYLKGTLYRLFELGHVFICCFPDY
jgi:hypothetical protein